MLLDRDLDQAGPHRPALRPRLAWVLVAVIMLVGVVGLLVGGHPTGSSAPPPSLQSPPARPATPQVPPLSAPGGEAGAAEEVTVGFYLNNVQDFDQQDGSYYADFFVWMRWKGKTDPSATFEFTNNIERWGLSQTAVFEEPEKLPSGEKLQQFRVQGRFFSPLDLTSYPLDKHTLTFDIEDTSAVDKTLVYVPESGESGVDAATLIPGWDVTGHSLTVLPHKYDTNFGETTLDKSTNEYSVARFSLSIERPITFFLFKLMLPLLIVILLVVSVLFVDPGLTEVRLAAPATALLTLVFLQQAYSDTLPAIASLVLLDQIYALAYALLMVLMVLVIMSSYWMKAGTDVAVRRTVRLDRLSAVGVLGVFALGAAILIGINA